MRFTPYGEAGEQSMFPQQWDNVTGMAGKSLGFVARPDMPNGIELHFVRQDSGRSVPGHDLVISATPGNFDSELGFKAMHLGAGSDSVFMLRFGPEQPGEPFFGQPQPSQDVALVPGRTYYLNWRASDGLDTHAQFWWRARTGTATVGTTPPAPAPLPTPDPAPTPAPVPSPSGPLRIAIPAGATYIEIG